MLLSSDALRAHTSLGALGSAWLYLLRALRSAWLYIYRRALRIHGAALKLRTLNTRTLNTRSRSRYQWMLRAKGKERTDTGSEEEGNQDSEEGHRGY